MQILYGDVDDEDDDDDDDDYESSTIISTASIIKYDTDITYQKGTLVESVI